MINIEDKSKCCGCTACYNICPKKCITMEADKEGFLYPVVDKGECIDCSLCENVCPVINPPKCKEDEPNTYVVRIKDEVMLKESASGGFFYAISHYVLKKQGVVCGVSYDDELKVYHTFAETIEEAKKFSGSKYVQSQLGDSFKSIKSFLENGRLVCFSGTTCQVTGLRSYLGKQYDNLILVDLICAGVPSPLLWDKYLKMQQGKYKSKVKKASFRHKTYGYQCSTMKLDFENGKVYSKSGRIDPMMKIFVSNIAKRPACYECAFKGINKCSDFTLFDAWSSEKLTSKKDDNKGYTSLIVQSDKGKVILEQLEEYLQKEKVSLNDAVNLDGIMIHKQPKRHLKRYEFYEKLCEEDVDGVIKRYMPINMKDYVLEYLKIWFYKLGIIQTVKKIKKSFVKPS